MGLARAVLLYTYSLLQGEDALSAKMPWAPSKMPWKVPCRPPALVSDPIRGYSEKSIDLALDPQQSPYTTACNTEGYHADNGSYAGIGRAFLLYRLGLVGLQASVGHVASRSSDAGLRPVPHT